MENPAYWKTAELVILDALEEFEYMTNRGIVGTSNVHLIADKLRESGHIKDQDEGIIGWDKLREHHNKKKS